MSIFNNNSFNPFGTNNLFDEINKTNQQINSMNLPQPKPQNPYRQQNIGNMLLAFSDVVKGRDPSAGVMQRKTMLDAQKKEAERKADIEAYLKTSEGSKYRPAYELKEKLGIDVSKTNEGTSLMQNAQALASLRKTFSEMSKDEQQSTEGILLNQQIQDFAGLGGALKYDANTAFEKNAAETAAKQGLSFGEGPLTTGQIATDKGFATFYKDYLSKGRGAKNVANVERLDDAKEIMKYAAKNKIAISSVPFSLVAQRPSLAAFFSPEGVMAQERVASVIQQSLKEILGGQFAEREGIALIQRGYNPALNPEENLERLLDLEAQVLQIVESEQDAVEYYENNRKSLAGYKGKRYTSNDFVRDLRKDYTMDIIDLSDQDIEDAYMSAGEGSIWMETLTKEINRRADKRR